MAQIGIGEIKRTLLRGIDNGESIQQTGLDDTRVHWSVLIVG